jgi:hypothetical protein
MDDALLVDVLQRCRDLPHRRELLREVAAGATEDGSTEIFTLEQLHDDVADIVHLTVVVHADDVVMNDAAENAKLREEAHALTFAAPAPMRGQYFDRNLAPDDRVVRAVDDSHATATEKVLKLVAAKPVARFDRRLEDGTGGRKRPRAHLRLNVERQDLPAVAPAVVVTRVIVVTSGDPRQLAVQGSTARVSQQHIWDRLARQLANEPAPNNGITRILHPPTITALENQLRQISGQGGHVSRMDWVGHGSDAGTHTEGFHLYGIHSGPEQWVSPDDMVRLIADTGIANGVSSFENRFWACYSDVWVDRVSEGLRRRGVPNPHATGQVGDFTPRYGPRAGHPADPERNWVVDPSGATQSSGQRQPTVSPGELRGL